MQTEDQLLLSLDKDFDLKQFQERALFKIIQNKDHQALMKYQAEARHAAEKFTPEEEILLLTEAVKQGFVKSFPILFGADTFLTHRTIYHDVYQNKTFFLDEAPKLDCSIIPFPNIPNSLTLLDVAFIVHLEDQRKAEQSFCDCICHFGYEKHFISPFLKNCFNELSDSVPQHKSDGRHINAFEILKGILFFGEDPNLKIPLNTQTGSNLLGYRLNLLIIDKMLSKARYDSTATINMQQVAKILSKHADVNLAFIVAVREAKTIKEILLFKGFTPQTVSITFKNYIQDFFYIDVDVNCRDENGRFTPLMLAAQNEDDELVDVLLQNGADATLLDPVTKQTVKDMVVQRMPTSKSREGLNNILTLLVNNGLTKNSEMLYQRLVDFLKKFKEEVPSLENCEEKQKADLKEQALELFFGCFYWIGSDRALTFNTKDTFFGSLDKLDFTERYQSLLNLGLFDLNTRVDAFEKTVFMQLFCHSDRLTEFNLEFLLKGIRERQYNIDFSLVDKEGRSIFYYLEHMDCVNPRAMQPLTQIFIVSGYAFKFYETILINPKFLRDPQNYLSILSAKLALRLSIKLISAEMLSKIADSQSPLAKRDGLIIVHIIKKTKAILIEGKIAFELSFIKDNFDSNKKIRKACSQNPKIRAERYLKLSEEEFVEILLGYLEHIGLDDNFEKFNKETITERINIEELMGLFFEKSILIKTLDQTHTKELEDKTRIERLKSLNEHYNQLLKKIKDCCKRVISGLAAYDKYCHYIDQEFSEAVKAGEKLQKDKKYQGEIRFKKFDKDRSNKQEDYERTKKAAKCYRIRTKEEDEGDKKKALELMAQGKEHEILKEENRFDFHLKIALAELESFQTNHLSLMNIKVKDSELDLIQKALDQLSAKIIILEKFANKFNIGSEDLVQSMGKFLDSLHSFIKDARGDNRKDENVFYNKTNKKKRPTQREEEEGRKKKEAEILSEMEKALPNFVKKMQQEYPFLIKLLSFESDNIISLEAESDEELDQNSHPTPNDDVDPLIPANATRQSSGEFNSHEEYIAHEIEKHTAALERKNEFEKTRLLNDERLTDMVALPDRADVKLRERNVAAIRENELYIKEEELRRQTAANAARSERERLASLQAQEQLSKLHAGSKDPNLTQFLSRNAKTANPSNTSALYGFDSIKGYDPLKILSALEQALKASESNKESNLDSRDLEYCDTERTALYYGLADLFEILRNLPKSFIDKTLANKLRHLLFKEPQNSCLINGDLKACLEYNQNLRVMITKLIKVITNHTDGKTIIEESLSKEQMVAKMSNDFFNKMLDQADKLPEKDKRPVPSHDSLRAEIERCNQGLARNHERPINPLLRELAEHGYMAVRSVNAKLLLKHYFRDCPDIMELREYKDAGNHLRHAAGKRSAHTN